MNVPTIDRATFADLQQTAGAEFVAELVGTFLTEAPRMIEDLRQALTANAADSFRRAAHSLKSNSLTFGAVTLAGMARELELGGLDAARANGGALDRIDAEYARVSIALREMCNA